MSDDVTFRSKYIDLSKQGYGRKYHCVYCGKELKEERELEDRDYHYYYYCDCEDAKKEEEIMTKIRALERQLPEEKYEARLQVMKKRGLGWWGWPGKTAKETENDGQE